MKHLKIKKILASLLVTVMATGAVSEGMGLLSRVSAGTSEIAVYEKADDDATLVEYITTDTVAEIIDCVEDEDGEYWYKIMWGHDDMGFEGYITEENATYLFWNDNSIMTLFSLDERATVGVEAFPEDYQALLQPLQEAHPNWTFVPFYVEPTWDTVVYEEMRGRGNFVYTTEVFSMKHLSVYDWVNDRFIGGSGPNWILASQIALEHYLEPRNFITEENIFLFESMRYNEALHTVDLVETVLNGTFMYQASLNGYTENVLLEDILAQLETVPELPVVDETESVEESTTQTTTEEPEGEQINKEENTTQASKEEPEGEQIGEEKDTTQASKEEPEGEQIGEEKDTTQASKEEPEGEQIGEENTTEAKELVQVGDIIEFDGENVKVVSIFEEAGEMWVEIEKSITYAQAFVKIGKEYNVSPVMLASRCRQEQGIHGTSALISGTVPGFEGYYNYFNMKASGITNEDIIRNGLTWAKQQGWSSPYKALKGGSLAVATNYIMKNQDTLYLQKFDIDPNDEYGMYWHQYMGAIASPSAEGRTARRSYADLGILDSYFVFKIPVYTNRPETPPAKPTNDINPNCYLSSITINNGEYPLDFAHITQEYTLTVPYECEQLKINATPASTRATLQGNGTYPLMVGDNKIVLSVTAQSGEVKNYTISINRKEWVGKGLNVSGSVNSWDNEENTIVKLYDSTMSDEAIREDMKTGTPTLALDIKATMGEIVENGNQFKQSFLLPGIDGGTYKVAIYKPGKYVVSVQEIVLEKNDIEIDETSMWLYGDVNYDGVVDVLDITQVTRYINLKTSIFDSGDDQTKANRLLAADVMGTDKTVDVLDITQYIRYINLKTSVFDTMH